MSAVVAHQQRVRLCANDMRCTLCGLQTANGQLLLCPLCHVIGYTCNWGSDLNVCCRGAPCPCAPSRQDLFKIEHVAGVGQVHKWKANAQ